MTNTSLKNRLCRGLNACVPTDGYDRIAEALPSVAPSIPRRRLSPLRWAAAAAAVCLLLACGVGGTMWYITHRTADTVIDIDVNPGIELAVNRADCVLTATAVNRDGEAVLTGLSLKDAPLAEAVSQIFDSMVTRGYVAENSNILITVQNSDATRAAQLRGVVTAHIDNTLTRHEVKAAVATQTLTAFDEATRFAQAHGISNGKAAFILSLIKQAPTLNADRLATYDFGALVVEAERHGVQLDSLVDYDAADGAWGEIQLTLEQQVEQAEQTLGCYLHTLEEVKQVALRGFDADFQASAVFVVAEFRWEGDIPAYHLEFVSSQGAVYCYVINAIDCSDLPTEHEKEQASTTPPETMVSGGGTVTSSRPTDNTTTAWIDQFIGGEMAESIAFAERMEAGADVTKAKQVTTTLGYRWGDAYYTVSFLLDDVKYTYDIDAISGEILSLDKEPQAITATTRPTDPAADGYINDNEAKTIAYKYVGITAEQADFISLERLYLDGTATKIDFRFIHDDWLYAFYIHSGTGAVIQCISAPADFDEDAFAISEKQAEHIAMADAGVTETDCTDRVMLIRENPSCFIVTFTVENVIYAYQISGDGTILSKENSEDSLIRPE